MASINANTEATSQRAHVPLIATLFDTEQGKLLYIFKAFALSLLPALGVSFLVAVLWPEAEAVTFEGGAVVLFVGLVVVSPVLETALLWLTLTIIGLFTRSLWVTALLAALFWAVLHSLSVPAWGLVIFWSFIVFSLAFLVWRQESRRDAFLVCCAVHMLQNGVAFLAVLLGGA